MVFMMGFSFEDSRIWKGKSPRQSLLSIVNKYLNSYLELISKVFKTKDLILKNCIIFIFIFCHQKQKIILYLKTILIKSESELIIILAYNSKTLQFKIVPLYWWSIDIFESFFYFEAIFVQINILQSALDLRIIVINV